MAEIVITKDKGNKALSNPLFSIIIVNTNEGKYILNCIQSIQDKIDAKRCPYEIIVSDNGSVDGSVEAIRERFPWVKVIENNTKYGFGKANNIGAKQAKGEVLFFLNPDTVIVDGIEEMVEYILRNREVGVINPLIVDEHDEFGNIYDNYKISSYLIVQFINLIYPKPFYLRWNSEHREKVNKMDVFRIERFYGCAFLIRRQLFKDIGCFDDKIFIYSEEDDITFRLKKIKYSCYCYPKSKIIHFGLQKNAGQNKYSFIVCNKRMLVSKRYLLKKYFPYTWVLRYLLDIGIIIRALITSTIKTIIMREHKDYDIIRNNIEKLKLAFLTLIDK